MTSVSDHTTEAEDMQEVLLEMMEQKNLGEASLTVKPMCTSLDRRKKTLGTDHSVNGSASLRTRTEEDLKRPIATFADGSTQPSVPVLAPVVNVKPAAPAKETARDT